ncbi:MAG: STAS domain-containing protein [Oscillospiraceae bacterium]|nr:STAS domain-containing protein [Oscillospiraceae bacterium]
MHFTSYLQDSRLTVLLTGEIDHHCAKTYITAINSKIEAYSPGMCVLDFSGVTFMDSSGIAVVINALRTMNASGGTLAVSSPQKQVMKVFRASGIDKLIKIEEEVS